MVLCSVRSLLATSRLEKSGLGTSSSFAHSTRSSRLRMTSANYTRHAARHAAGDPMSASTYVHAARSHMALTLLQAYLTSSGAHHHAAPQNGVGSDELFVKRAVGAVILSGRPH